MLIRPTPAYPDSYNKRKLIVATKAKRYTTNLTTCTDTNQSLNMTSDLDDEDR
jgi:hypothetical protein